MLNQKSKQMEGENLFDDQPVEQRAALLEANAVRVEDESVKRYYTPAELETMKNELSDLSIKKDDEEEALKAISKIHKDKIKELKAQLKENLTGLRERSYTQREKVYLMDDQKAGLMNYYDSQGIFIRSRKLLPGEKQTRIMDQTAKAS